MRQLVGTVRASFVRDEPVLDRSESMYAPLVSRHLLGVQLAASLLVGIALVAAGCHDGLQDGFSNDDVIDAAFSLDISIHEEIPTVVDVEWSLAIDDLQDAYVEYGTPDGSLYSVAAAHSGDQFEATLVGLTPVTEYEVRAVVFGDGVEYASPIETFTTGAIPFTLPGVELAFSPEEEERPGYLVTTLFGEHGVALILDGAGRAVWWHPSAPVPGGTIQNTRLSSDGRYVLYMTKSHGGGMEPGSAGLVRVDIHTSEVRFFALEGLHHDMVELPDGTIASLGQGFVDGGSTEVLGDQIVELYPDGTMDKVWFLDDHIPYDPGLLTVQPEEGATWSHANALDYDAERDAYIVGLRNLSTIIVVDRASGDIVEQIGSVDSDYESTSAGAVLFDSQHQFHWLDDRLLVFDNGLPQDFHSRVVEFELSPERGTAELVWEHTTSPPVYCPALGDVTRMTDGGTLVSWSTAGQIEEISPSGEVRWQLNLDLGAGFGYTTHVESLGDY